MKTTITENLPNWSHGPQPYLTQWNYEPCHLGPLKTSRSWWRVLAKRGPLEKEMANHFSILGLRTPWSMKRQKDRTLKDELSRLVITFLPRSKHLLISCLQSPPAVRTTVLSNSMKLSYAVWGHPRWSGHGGEVWQNVVHWRREWQTTSVFLPWEPHEQYEKVKW